MGERGGKGVEHVKLFGMQRTRGEGKSIRRGIQCVGTWTPAAKGARVGHLQRNGQREVCRGDSKPIWHRHSTR